MPKLSLYEAQNTALTRTKQYIDDNVEEKKNKLKCLFFC